MNATRMELFPTTWPRVERRCRQRVAPSPENPCASLFDVLAVEFRDGYAWHQMALRACRTAHGAFLDLSRGGRYRDRDAAACVDAILHSLDWALASGSSSAELRCTMQRITDHYGRLRVAERRSAHRQTA